MWRICWRSASALINYEAKRQIRQQHKVQRSEMGVGLPSSQPQDGQKALSECSLECCWHRWLLWSCVCLCLQTEAYILLHSNEQQPKRHLLGAHRGRPWISSPPERCLKQQQHLDAAFRNRAESSAGLTVFREDGTLNHSGHRSVESEPGLHLILIEQDMFKVDMEDVKDEEGAVHKALQQRRRLSVAAGLLHIYARNKLYTQPSCIAHQHQRERRSGIWSHVSVLCNPSFLPLAAPEVYR